MPKYLIIVIILTAIHKVFRAAPNPFGIAVHHHLQGFRRMKQMERKKRMASFILGEVILSTMPISTATNRCGATVGWLHTEGPS